ncbi:MAG: phosphocholine cytidylyltransferase family protein [Spirochaetota bacterium]|nr:phosphocholine cytidylyltransferase family protein [Spirochaetota bacterium]
MQALILAAGMAERLRPLTIDHPKCLVEIGGKAFLDRMISNILAYGITDINIITGFKVHKVKDFLKERFPNLKVNFYHNKRFYETNNSYSLWLAKDLIHSDFLLFDADIIFDHRILEKILNTKHENALMLRRSSDLSEEEMKVKIDGNNRILEINKTIHPKDAAGESLGIEKFSYECAKHLFNKLDENMLKKNLVNDFYEKSFEGILEEGAEIYAVDVDGLKCAEVDFVEDIHYVEEHILPFIQSKD